MNWAAILSTTSSVISALICAWLATQAFRRRESFETIPFVILFASLSLYSTVSAFAYSFISEGYSRGSLDLLRLLSISAGHALWAVFAIKMAGAGRFLRRSSVSLGLLLIGFPIILTLLGSGEAPFFAYGSGYSSIGLSALLQIAVFFTLSLLGAAFLLRFVANDLKKKRERAVLFAAGAALPLLANVFSCIGTTLDWRFEFLAPAFAVSGIACVTSLYGVRFVGKLFFSRASLIDQMEQSVIVVDSGGTITDMNQAARSLFSGDASKQIGANAAPLLIELTRGSMFDPTEADGSEYVVENNGRKRWFDVKISTLKVKKGQVSESVGSLVVLNEVTKLKTLENDERRRIRELEAVRQTMSDILSDLELQNVLDSILRRVVDLLDAEFGRFGLYRQTDDSINVVSAFQEPIASATLGLPIDENGFNKAIKERKAFIVQNYEEWEERDPKLVYPFSVSMMYVPLKREDELLGILSIGADSRKRTFGEGDISLIETLAQEAAVAVKNAQLFAEIERLAITDDLTGVANRRHFLQLARAEMERAIRRGMPLSLILFDIDFFKKVNDTFGHDIGDKVLRAVGTTCRSIFRSYDICGRYGGEEFVVLFPETKFSDAVKVAERFRAKIENKEIDCGGEIIKITVSIGVSHLMEIHKEIEELIQEADRAMYRAKEAGRNAIRLAD